MPLSPRIKTTERALAVCASPPSTLISLYRVGEVCTLRPHPIPSLRLRYGRILMDFRGLTSKFPLLQHSSLHPLACHPPPLLLPRRPRPPLILVLRLSLTFRRAADNARRRGRGRRREAGAGGTDPLLRPSLSLSLPPARRACFAWMSSFVAVAVAVFLRWSLPLLFELLLCLFPQRTHARFPQILQGHSHPLLHRHF